MTAAMTQVPVPTATTPFDYNEEEKLVWYFER